MNEIKLIFLYKSYINKTTLQAILYALHSLPHKMDRIIAQASASQSFTIDPSELNSIVMHQVKVIDNEDVVSPSPSAVFESALDDNVLIPQEQVANTKKSWLDYARSMINNKVTLNYFLDVIEDIFFLNRTYELAKVAQKIQQVSDALIEVA